MKHRRLPNDFAGASPRERRRPRRPPIWMHHVLWIRAATYAPSLEHRREPVTPCQGYPTTLQARNPGNAGALAGPQSGHTTSCGYMPRPTNQAVSIYGNPLDLADEAPNLDTPLTVVRAATYAPSREHLLEPVRSCRRGRRRSQVRASATHVHPRDLHEEVATIAQDCVTPDIDEAQRLTQRLRRRSQIRATKYPRSPTPLPV